jgi:hypothetical protein
MRTQRRTRRYCDAHWWRDMRLDFSQKLLAGGMNSVREWHRDDSFHCTCRTVFVVLICWDPRWQSLSSIVWGPSPPTHHHANCADESRTGAAWG